MTLDKLSNTIMKVHEGTAMSSIGDIIKARQGKLPDKLLSQEEKSLKEFEVRRKSKDLLFMDFKTWFRFINHNKQNNINYDDPYLYSLSGTSRGLNRQKIYFPSSNDGVFTSRKEISKQKASLPQYHDYVWDSKNMYWVVRDMLESKKAESLLSMIQLLEVRTEDISVPKILASIDQLSSIPRTIELLETIIDNIVHSRSKLYCIAENMSYDESVYTKLKDIQISYNRLLEELSMLI